MGVTFERPRSLGGDIFYEANLEGLHFAYGQNVGVTKPFPRGTEFQAWCTLTPAFATR